MSEKITLEEAAGTKRCWNPDLSSLCRDWVLETIALL